MFGSSYLYGNSAASIGSVGAAIDPRDTQPRNLLDRVLAGYPQVPRP
jgi:hypothetical protein